MYYQLLGKCERFFAKRQGKGWGAASVSHELKAAASLLGVNNSVKLAVDVGGNIGNYTAQIKNMHPHAEVHIFEPSSTNLKLLNERFSEQENIFIQPVALASSSDSATLYADKPGSGLGSLTKRRLDHRGNDFAHSEQITTEVLDHYWQDKLQGRSIDLLKLDIEGHELDALKGAINTLAKTRVVQFEFGGCNIDTRTYFQDFWYFFKELNFDLYRITPRGVMRVNRYRERDEFFSTTNYLALSQHP